jgi:hypothetical protein
MKFDWISEHPALDLSAAPTDDEQLDKDAHVQIRVASDLIQFEFLVVI